jgi:xanthine dehydrogenase accessory factor
MHFFDRLAELESERCAFAVATVVARQSPVSSHLGDRAVIYADGRMEGFVGGSCSRDIVRREALRSLRTARPRLLQIRPDDSRDDAFPGPVDAERVRVPMRCASNGAVDVYIEPHLPPRVLIVVGYTPVGEALARVAAASREFDVVRAVVDEELRDVEAVEGVRVVSLVKLGGFLDGLDRGSRARSVAIVASQGHYDEAALQTLLSAPSAFVGLLASRKRAGSVKGVLRQQGITPDLLDRIHNPVGLAIGARTAAEVAISILAEIIASPPASAELEDDALGAADRFASDPVCGMDVEIEGSRSTVEAGGRTFYFCGDSCRAMFSAEPNKYLIAFGPT